MDNRNNFIKSINLFKRNARIAKIIATKLAVKKKKKEEKNAGRIRAVSIKFPSDLKMYIFVSLSRTEDLPLCDLKLPVTVLILPPSQSALCYLFHHFFLSSIHVYMADTQAEVSYQHLCLLLVRMLSVWRWVMMQILLSVAWLLAVAIVIQNENIPFMKSKLWNRLVR